MAAMSTAAIINEKRPPQLLAVTGGLWYSVLGVKMRGGRGGATLATLARAAVRARFEKQRSRAESTRDSISTAVRRITSDTSEMIRNFARSSMRFSRNERLFDFARNVRFLSTSATS